MMLLHKRIRRTGPRLGVDLYGRETLSNPVKTYRRIRETGAAVWLPKHQMWAVGRHRDVRQALRDDDTFRSGHGVAANKLTNALTQGTTVASDGDEHANRRRVLLHSLSAKALADVEPTLQQEASGLVDQLLKRGTFDGVSDFATHLPVRVVADLIGVDIDHGQMLRWARAGFNGLGPLNRRGLAALPDSLRFVRYARALRPEHLSPGGWAAAIAAAADDGILSVQEAKTMMIGIISPSLDTTILASAQLLWSLARTPGVWDELRDNPDLVPAAALEAVRLSSPVRGFTRVVHRDVEIEDSQLRAGDRVVLLYASANMDETQYQNPEVFSLHRKGANLGWGFGAHACVGMHLSKLEMHALLRAMIPVVADITTSAPVPLLNNTLQGFASFRATFGADHRGNSPARQTGPSL
jgi:cytochrome P450